MYVSTQKNGRLSPSASNRPMKATSARSIIGQAIVRRVIEPRPARPFGRIFDIELGPEQQAPEREHDQSVSQREGKKVDQARIPGSLPPLSRDAVDAPLRLPWHTFPRCSECSTSSITRCRYT